MLAAAALAVAVVNGCKGKEKEVVGKWTGANGVAMNLNPDKTFFQAGANPSAPSVTGHWSVSGENVTLRVEQIGGKSIDEIFKQITAMMPKNGGKKPDTSFIDLLKNLQFTLSADGKTLNFVPPANLTAAQKQQMKPDQMKLTKASDTPDPVTASNAAATK